MDIPFEHTFRRCAGAVYETDFGSVRIGAAEGMGRIDRSLQLSFNDTHCKTPNRRNWRKGSLFFLM
jgi:hypothetical protein